MKKIFYILLAFVSLAAVWGVLSSMSSTGCCEINRVDTITISGNPYLSQDMKVTVALPSSYCSKNDSTFYPVIYLLNGHGGNYKNWPSIVPVDSIADTYGAIVICPSGMNSWYFDSPLDPGMKMESFFIEKLIPTVDSLYRTRTDPQGRAISGFSMGGHGALWLAIRHSDVFGSAGSSSGGVDFTPWPKNWNLANLLGERDQNPQLWKEHTVMSLVDSLKPGQINIIVDCGTEDFFYDVNCRLDSALNAGKIHHVFRTEPGAHNGEYWSRNIYPQLDFFRQMFDRQ